jgi:hypothetical protein
MTKEIKACININKNDLKGNFKVKLNPKDMFVSCKDCQKEIRDELEVLIKAQG